MRATPLLLLCVAVSETVLSDNGTVQQVKALVPADSGQRFVHLKVTGPP